MRKLSISFLGKVFSKQETNLIIMPDGVYTFSIEKVLSGQALITTHKASGKKKTFYQDLCSPTVFSENEVLELLSLKKELWGPALEARRLARHQVFSFHSYLSGLAASYEACIAKLFL